MPNIPATGKIKVSKALVIFATLIIVIAAIKKAQTFPTACVAAGGYLLIHHFLANFSQEIQARCRLGIPKLVVAPSMILKIMQDHTDEFQSIGIAISSDQNPVIDEIKLIEATLSGLFTKNSPAAGIS
jgi:hypothetical protein